MVVYGCVSGSGAGNNVTPLVFRVFAVEYACRLPTGSTTQLAVSDFRQQLIVVQIIRNQATNNLPLPT